MRPPKITFGDMREMGVRGVLFYCADYRCSRHVALSADRWPDEVRLSDIELRFICTAPAAGAAPMSGPISTGTPRAYRWHGPSIAP
ncbi:hypothetical protein [Bradyrhizobium cytisi]|uniref:hypothetical protein n=1 Tax=Bradyrhizobium cytisi TaxID=515489 RepID=UPI001FE2E448|nr:hypothetical protein [Bradyrhizobium cytisi]